MKWSIMNQEDQTCEKGPSVISEFGASNSFEMNFKWWFGVWFGVWNGKLRIKVLSEWEFEVLIGWILNCVCMMIGIDVVIDGYG